MVKLLAMTACYWNNLILYLSLKTSAILTVCKTETQGQMTFPRMMHLLMQNSTPICQENDTHNMVNSI